MVLGGLLLVGVLAAGLFGSGYLPKSMGPLSRVQTPFGAPRIMENGSSFSPELTSTRLWGSYRYAVVDAHTYRFAYVFPARFAILKRLFKK